MTTIKILIIPADPAEPLTWRDVDRGLAAFQDIVGGDVQVVPLHVPGCDLWCNENVGPRTQFNVRATALYHQAGGVPWDSIRGDTFVTGGTDDDGEVLSLTPEQTQELQLPEPVAS